MKTLFATLALPCGVSVFGGRAGIGSISNLVIVSATRFATYTYPSGPWLKATGTAWVLYKNFTSLRLLTSTTYTSPSLTSVKKTSF